MIAVAGRNYLANAIATEHVLCRYVVAISRLCLRPSEPAGRGGTRPSSNQIENQGIGVGLWISGAVIGEFLPLESLS